MTNNDLAAGRWPSLAAQRIRAWWPVPAFVASSLVMQSLLLNSRYDVGGHAAGHLGGASAPFSAGAVLCILLWATPQARRQVDLIAVCTAWFVATLAVMVGNLRVVDDLIDAGYSHTPTGSVPDIADHSMANSSIWCAEAVALLLIAAWRHRRHTGNRATIGAVLSTLMIPPWIIPGAGVFVLAIVCLVQRGRNNDALQVSGGPDRRFARRAPSGPRR